jgi:hypothetical protein
MKARYPLSRSPRSVRAKSKKEFVPEVHEARVGYHRALSLLEVYESTSEKLRNVRALYQWRGRITTRYFAIYYKAHLPQFPRFPPAELLIKFFKDPTTHNQFHIVDFQVLAGTSKEVEGITKSDIASIAHHTPTYPLPTLPRKTSGHSAPYRADEHNY